MQPKRMAWAVGGGEPPERRGDPLAIIPYPQAHPSLSFSEEFQLPLQAWGQAGPVGSRCCAPLPGPSQGPPTPHWLSTSVPTAQQPGGFFTCCCPASLPLPGQQLFPDSWIRAGHCLPLNRHDSLLPCPVALLAHPPPCGSNVLDLKF